MKACVFGIPNFLFGKKTLPDPRLKKLEELYRSQKVTQIQVEFTAEKDIKTADAVVCLSEKKLDLLILDMEVLEARAEKQLAEHEKSLLAKCQALLEKETPLCQEAFTDDEQKWLANNNLVTIKPVIFISSEEAGDLPALTRKVYDGVGMISFLTGGVKESRAWELKKNANAVEAAGAIHSDIERGFIRAEVLSYDDLVRVGNVNQAKNEGCLRQEGKDYIVKDGDVIEFKFSV
jgi:ribosome-binding ATPase YchF (GTP1/OBG family)